MALQLGDVAPDFEAETTEGRIKFHDWLGDSWGVLFSHPKDFTPVCTTELGYMASIEPEFAKRGVKIIGLSVDPLDKHEEWVDDIEATQGARPDYPIISDADFEVAKAYGMLAADVSGDPGERTPADNQTVRNVFVIGPDKKIKLILVYPMTTGRNFDEVLRVIDSLQLTAKHKVATPAQWQQGDDVIIAGSVSNEQAKEIFRRLGGAAALHPHRPAARTATRSSVEALQEVAEDPGRGSPDELALHLVGGGADGDAAADQAAHLVALAQDLEREGEDGLDLGRVGYQAQLGRVGDEADEGVDAVAGDEGRDRRQRPDQLDPRPAPARSPPAASRSAVVARSASISSRRPPGKEISPACRRRSARRSVKISPGSSGQP